MIIVSQDKTHILNFENIQDIRIEPRGTHIKSKKIYKIFAGNFEGYATELGIYNTEERAKEVLQEIVGLYRRCQQVIGERGGVANFIYSPKVYEMPRE